MLDRFPSIDPTHQIGRGATAASIGWARASGDGVRCRAGRPRRHAGSHGSSGRRRRFVERTRSTRPGCAKKGVARRARAARRNREENRREHLRDRRVIGRRVAKLHCRRRARRCPAFAEGLPQGLKHRRGDQSLRRFASAIRSPSEQSRRQRATGVEGNKRDDARRTRRLRFRVVSSRYAAECHT